MDLAPGPLNAQNNLTPKVRLGASRSEVFTCLKIQNVPFYPFVIKTQENNEIVVPNSVMASQAIIKSA